MKRSVQISQHITSMRHAHTHAYRIRKRNAVRDLSAGKLKRRHAALHNAFPANNWSSSVHIQRRSRKSIFRHETEGSDPDSTHRWKREVWHVLEIFHGRHYVTCEPHYNSTRHPVQRIHHTLTAVMSKNTFQHHPAQSQCDPCDKAQKKCHLPRHGDI